MVIAMGTRSLLLCSALVGFTSTAMAQTSSLDDASYTLTATVTQAPANTDKKTPILLVQAPAVETPAAADVVDGGDGISDAPDAGWISEPKKKRLD